MNPVMDIDGIHFQHTYCCSLSSKLVGNRIIMPLSAVDLLVYSAIQMPWFFSLTNPLRAKTTHCGVLEFTSEEGLVLLSPWMMKLLELEEGEIVNFMSVHLKKGEFLKLQPHTKNFLQISDPKAVLEKSLRDFCCLTAGDTVMVTDNGIDFYLNVVEAKPSSAIDMIDIDCEVDFAPPLDYEEEAQVRIRKEKGKIQKEEKSEKFKAFTGVGRRLNGESVSVIATEEVAVAAAADDDDDSIMNAERKVNSKPGKLVFGSRENNGFQSQKSSTEQLWKESLEKGKEFEAFTGSSYSLL